MDNYRALFSKNKNRAKGFYQPESRRELHPPRNVNANLVKILVSPPQLSSGGEGGLGAEEELERRYLDCNSSSVVLPSPATQASRHTVTHTHAHTPKPQPFPPSPHAPTSGLGSLETVVEARGARRGSEGSLSRGGRARGDPFPRPPSPPPRSQQNK